MHMPRVPDASWRPALPGGARAARARGRRAMSAPARAPRLDELEFGDGRTSDGCLVSTILGSASSAQNMGPLSALAGGRRLRHPGRPVVQPGERCPDEPGAVVRPRPGQRRLHRLLSWARSPAPRSRWAPPCLDGEPERSLRTPPPKAGDGVTRPASTEPPSRTSLPGSEAPAGLPGSLTCRPSSLRASVSTTNLGELAWPPPGLRPEQRSMISWVVVRPSCRLGVGPPMTINGVCAAGRPPAGFMTTISCHGARVPYGPPRHVRGS
jgi:hypothetical protein